MSDKRLTDALGDMKQQIRSLAACLGREKVLVNSGIFYGVLESLDQGKPANGALPWRYTLTKTELRLESSHVRWPENSTAFICSFDLAVKGRICLAPTLANANRLPKNAALKRVSQSARKDWKDFMMPKDVPCWTIDELKCDMQLLAHSGGSSKWEQFWHFDRHVASTKPSSDPLEVHPLFHLHFGGDRLAEGRAGNKLGWGNLLELHAPRIAHPPMDVVLLIDFILANFSGQMRRNLVENKKEYQDIIQAAQQRFWCPYKTALGDYFQSDRQQQKTHLARELWPLLAGAAN